MFGGGFSAAVPDETRTFRTTIGPATWSGICDQLMGWDTAAPVGNAWPLTNLGLFIPFQTNQRAIAYSVFWATGTGAGGNADVGIYDTAGNRLASTGTTARGAASSWISTDWTDYTIEPGRYYLGMSTDGVLNYISWAGVTSGLLEASGVCEATSAFVLPNPVTLVRTTRAFIPMVGLNLKSVAF